MLIAPLPFEYVTLLDPGDRVRKTRKVSATRVRRTNARKIRD
jgi:hypothetical protein